MEFTKKALAVMSTHPNFLLHKLAKLGSKQYNHFFAPMFFCILGLMVIFLLFSVLWFSIYLVLWIWSTDPTRFTFKVLEIRKKAIREQI